MGNKAIVFICVDGPSDIDSLRQPFEDLFDTIGQEDVELLFRHPKYQGIIGLFFARAFPYSLIL